MSMFRPATEEILDEYRAAAEECAAVDPAAAVQWYERALAAGGDPLDQAALHAEVVALVGDLDRAMVLARQAVGELGARHRGRDGHRSGLVNLPRRPAIARQGRPVHRPQTNSR